ncbi:conjugal transfer protein MobA [Sphingobacterium siyangense]|uniref:conjugal transfer protein MobA n=1 Tax=Sphingobacterium siyangense TaxID=459529 RepID=UPI003DA3DABD
MNENNKRQVRKPIGRPFKTDPAIFRYSLSLNEEENAKFLALFDQSNMDVKAHFIKSRIFDKTIKTIQIDKGTVDFYMRLTSFHSQFRNVGVNYNQIIKLLYKNFSQKKASAYLFKLEKQTAEMAMLCRKIIELTEEFEAKYLKNHSKK